MKDYKLVNNLYLEKGEEILAKYIIPEYFIGRNLAKNNVSADYALRFLQNEMNELLHSFLNGGFSYSGYILFPLSKGISRANTDKLSRLLGVAVFLDGNGCDFSGSIKKYNETANKAIGSRNFAEILSALFDDFSRTKGRSAKSIIKPECKELDLKVYKKSDSKYIKPLKDLKDYANDNLRRFLLGFYLHGSLATNDYIKGWSDVDTLAVVSKETVQNPKNMLKLRDEIYQMRHFFYKIDPLQHHGSIIISEYDAENYCQTYFPIPVFSYAKSFFEDDAITKFKARQFQSEALAKLFWFVSYFRKLNIEKNFNLNSYDTKNLLHSITLFPSMYLQAKGVLVYKKYSFELARKDFSNETWKIMDIAGSIRSNWKGFSTIPLIGMYSRINPLLWYRLNSKFIGLFRDVKKINRINIKNLAEGMFNLSEEAWSRAAKDAKGKRL